MNDNPFDKFDDGSEFVNHAPETTYKRVRKERAPRKRKNNSGQHYGGSASKRKYGKKNKVEVNPLEVFLPILLLFEDAVTPETIEATLPDAIRWCKTNGYSLRVKAPKAVVEQCKKLDPSILVINHWTGFKDIACTISPSKYDISLTRFIWKWLTSKKDIVSTFRATTITALLGTVYHGRAYAMITYTEDGSIDVNEQQDAYTHMKPPLQIAEMYRIPTINLARKEYMDDLQVALGSAIMLIPQSNTDQESQF